MKVAIDRTPEMEAAEAVGLAAALAVYGRRVGSADALLASAALLLENPAPLGLAGEDDAEVAASLSPEVLLREAGALGSENAEMQVRIEQLRSVVPPVFPPVRGAERGPIRYASAADGETSRRHTVLFRGRETATFHLIGDGSSDLDYYLYDVNDELVASSRDASDSATLVWYVPYRQQLTLRVQNRGERRNAYHIVTN